MSLYYLASSKETSGWSKAKKVLSPTVGTQYWDNKGIYRSSFIYENGKYIVFYSGTNNELHHGIGMVYGTEMNKLKKVNIDFTDKDNAKMKVDRILGR